MSVTSKEFCSKMRNKDNDDENRDFKAYNNNIYDL